MMPCGVVWCGVVWCSVVWCGVAWCGLVMIVVMEMMLNGAVKNDRNMVVMPSCDANARMCLVSERNFFSLKPN